MIFAMNGVYEPCVQFAYENGWCAMISMDGAQNVTVLIVPTYISENLEEMAQRDINLLYQFNREPMVKRGDAFVDYKGTDNELIKLLANVANRPTEPHLEKTRQDILKAARA
jgi:hypothetical protein